MTDTGAGLQARSPFLNWYIDCLMQIACHLINYVCIGKSILTIDNKVYSTIAQPDRAFA